MSKRLLTATAVATVLAGGAASAQADELYLFNWTSYTSTEAIEKFEEEYGISVTLDTYTSNEDLMSVLRGGATYDVALPSGSFVIRMIEEDMLYPFDATSMENFENVIAPHDSLYFDPERMYSAPYMWGTTGIAYRTDALPEGEELEESWSAIFEPREEFQGEIGMLNDPGEVTTAAAFYLGLDPCTEDPEDWQQIQELLEAQNPNVKAYNSGGTDASIVSGEILMHQTWNGATHRAWREIGTVGYLYPEEGVVSWTDNFVIPKGAENVENAKKFINFMMRPDVAAMSSNFSGYSNAIRGSEGMLVAELAESPAVNVPEGYEDRMEMIPPCSQRSEDLRDRVWTRLMQ